LNIQLGALTLGWREMLLAAVLMLGIYMLFVAWLMRRVRSHAHPEPVEPTVQAAAGAAAYAATAAVDDAEPERESPAEAPEEPVAPPAELAATSVPLEGLRSEMAQMREELDALRAEFSVLRTEVQQEAAQIKATQSISPLYSDAMQMASAGHSAALIAERCGISRGEAELVVALVKSQA